MGHPTGQRGEYFELPAQWLAYAEHVRYAQQFADVMTVEYEDLIRHPADVQHRLTEFIGWHVRLPFDQFHTAASPDFRGGCNPNTSPLNGVRPLDPTRLKSWREDRHRERIRQILQEFPELPEYLIEMGYEPDESWVRNYL